MIRKSIRKLNVPAGRGSVLIIATLLLSSASIRLITSATGAFAQDGQLPAATIQGAHSGKNEDGLQAAVQDTVSDASKHGKLSALLKALHDRELQVTERERQIEMRLQALTIADAEIEKRIIALTETEQALRATLSLADEASEKDLLRLTAVYESMKPKDAAVLFEEMEPNFSAGFLGRMRPDAAAEIMSGLSPQAAYSISVILAGRNASAPKS